MKHAEAKPESRTVEDLQRDLLAICRGGVRVGLGKLSHVRELRRQIHALDPRAALYFGWAGPGDDSARDFHANEQRSCHA